MAFGQTEGKGVGSVTTACTTTNCPDCQLFLTIKISTSLGRKPWPFGCELVSRLNLTKQLDHGNMKTRHTAYVDPVLSFCWKSWRFGQHDSSFIYRDLICKQVTRGLETTLFSFRSLSNQMKSTPLFSVQDLPIYLLFSKLHSCKILPLSRLLRRFLVLP